MHSRSLVSGLPRTLPALPPSPAPPCIPCVEGRQRAAPHSSSFPPTEAPLQTLHLDVWGPARVRGQGHERYFLCCGRRRLHRYTTVFPLRSKGQVPDVLIPWIRAVRLQLRERFERDFPVLRLHSDRGVMEVARTSMIHAAAPHFLWPFAVRYAAHQLNLWPRVSLPETSPTLLWTGKVGDASRFRVWGARAFVRDTTADKLSARAIPCVFLGFVPDAPGWQFYHPTSRRVFASQDVTFDESVPFYRLFPYRTAPLLPRRSSSLQVDPPPFPAPVEVTGDSGPAGGGPARGATSGGAESGGAGPGGAEPGGAELEGVEPGGAEPACEGSGVLELVVLGLLRVRALEVLELLAGGLVLVALELLRVLALRVQSLLLRGLLGVAAFVHVCLSPCSSCTTGTVAVRVALLEPGALLLEVLLLPSLELGVVLVLFLLEVLESLVPEVLVLEVLELLGLRVLRLEVLLLETPRLETLGLEVLVLGVLETWRLETLGLEVLVSGGAAAGGTGVGDPGPGGVGSAAGGGWA
ncbi:unnamed protein product [Closterium sp. Yama58-4]|nr:unnamed protein product [Closterium sp. Yama58-4]